MGSSLGLHLKFCRAVHRRYENTERRQKMVHEKGILYLGMGVSGGEEGARNGTYHTLAAAALFTAFCATARENWASSRTLLG